MQQSNESVLDLPCLLSGSSPKNDLAVLFSFFLWFHSPLPLIWGTPARSFAFGQVAEEDNEGIRPRRAFITFTHIYGQFSIRHCHLTAKEAHN